MKCKKDTMAWFHRWTCLTHAH